jgi:SAM-dependent methyltransferase
MQVIAEDIVAYFKPASVLDVGCGGGALLQSLKSHGVRGLGLEYSEPALQMCRAREVSVLKFDLERDEWTQNETFDVAVSTEVAEHLPEGCADRLVHLLCRAANTIIFTAAPPGQGGTDHVNEQPPEYWIEKFSHHAFMLDEPLTLKWRRAWKARRIVSFYYQNLLIFRRDRMSGSQESSQSASFSKSQCESEPRGETALQTSQLTDGKANQLGAV